MKNKEYTIHKGPGIVKLPVQNVVPFLSLAVPNFLLQEGFQDTPFPLSPHPCVGVPV